MEPYQMSLVSGAIHEVFWALEPQILEIINEPGSVWENGPHGLLVAVMVPEMPFVCWTYGGTGLPKDYSARWAMPFGVLAVVKAATALSEGLPSEDCRPNPLIFADDERQRNYMGGVVDDKFAVGASALTERANKMCASLILPPVKREVEALISRGKVELLTPL